MKRCGEGLGGKQTVEGIMMNGWQLSGPEHGFRIDPQAFNLEKRNLSWNPDSRQLRQGQLPLGMLSAISQTLTSLK
ncbi:MAG: hypothetical protein H0V56_15345 [Chthoniobacterales bacterium]|nr:hypothetical protein [Chthoniobacterales bacterium]